MELLVAKGDFHKTRFEADTEAPEPGDGEAVLAINSFGLTSNNITYVVFGDAMNYWNFFPAPEDDWGRPPVWGYAEVAASNVDGVEEGKRLYGYFPCASHLVVQPDGVEEYGFIDGAEHRRPLPSAYQGYRFVEADPAYDADRENESVIFWPLFYTSWLIDDFIADSDLWGAERVVISSASSKTAIIAAYMLAQREGIDLIGLTSPGNVEFTSGVGIYGDVLSYEQVDALPDGKTVYVDIAGDGAVREAVHARYGDDLTHSAVVGAARHDQLDSGSGGELAGPKPTFFFAPDRIKIRGKEWGTPELEKRVADSWHPFAEWTGSWFKTEPIGPDAVETTYLQILDGVIDPSVGHVVSL